MDPERSGVSGTITSFAALDLAPPTKPSHESAEGPGGSWRSQQAMPTPIFEPLSPTYVHPDGVMVPQSNIRLRQHIDNIKNMTGDTAVDAVGQLLGWARRHMTENDQTAWFIYEFVTALPPAVADFRSQQLAAPELKAVGFDSVYLEPFEARSKSYRSKMKKYLDERRKAVEGTSSKVVNGDPWCSADFWDHVLCAFCDIHTSSASIFEYIAQFRTHNIALTPLEVLRRAQRRMIKRVCNPGRSRNGQFVMAADVKYVLDHLDDTVCLSNKEQEFAVHRMTLLPSVQDVYWKNRGVPPEAERGMFNEGLPRVRGVSTVAPAAPPPPVVGSVAKQPATPSSNATSTHAIAHQSTPPVSQYGPRPILPDCEPPPAPSSQLLQPRAATDPTTISSRPSEQQRENDGHDGSGKGRDPDEDKGRDKDKAEEKDDDREEGDRDTESSESSDDEDDDSDSTAGSNYTSPWPHVATDEKWSEMVNAVGQSNGRESFQKTQCVLATEMARWDVQLGGTGKVWNRVWLALGRDLKGESLLRLAALEPTGHQKPAQKAHKLLPKVQQKKTVLPKRLAQASGVRADTRSVKRKSTSTTTTLPPAKRPVSVPLKNWNAPQRLPRQLSDLTDKFLPEQLIKAKVPAPSARVPLAPRDPVPIAQATRLQRAVWSLVHHDVTDLSQREFTPVPDPTRRQFLEAAQEESLKVRRSVHATVGAAVHDLCSLLVPIGAGADQLTGLLRGFQIATQLTSITGQERHLMNQVLGKWRRTYGQETMLTMATTDNRVDLHLTDLERFVADEYHDGWLNGEAVFAAMTASVEIHRQARQVEADEVWVVVKPDQVGRLEGNTPSHPLPDGCDRGMTRKVFMPLHVSGNHWMLLTIDPGVGHVRIFDSLFNSSTMKHVRGVAQQFLQRTGHGDLVVDIKKHVAVQQVDGSSCGIWVLMHAHSIMRTGRGFAGPVLDAHRRYFMQLIWEGIERTDQNRSALKECNPPGTTRPAKQ